MYTQCPDCQTRFRVTAGALRAAHGTVRCGRCGSAFDALPRLSDAVPRTRTEPPAIPIDLRSDAEFAPAEVVDLAPVIEAELARLDQADLARLEETELDTVDEPTAESTVVLVDEGGAAEDITLEGEGIQVEGLAEPPPEARARERLPTEDAEPETEEEIDEADIDAEYDLDATDRFEVLQIPASAYPDPQEAEREFEALVQRLQREFDARTTAPVDATEPGEETAETVALAAQPTIDQTAILEPLLEEAAPEPTPPAMVEPPAPLPETEQLPSAAAVPEPTVDMQPEAAAAAPEREAAVVVPVGERPLWARRWRPAPEELVPDTAPERSAAGVLAWSLGILLLALALGAQVVHHYRLELARDPRVGPALRTVYERLAIPLPPGWDLDALELRQWGNDAREGGRMIVRASLTNRASFAQPLPVLRLQFEDRYGVMIAERDFEPADYLQDPARATRSLAPGESSEAELALADPGADAVGYRLEVCLRESPTRLRCASGPG